MFISRKHVSLVLIGLLIVTLLFLGACARKLPDIPFSGARATYEITHDPSLMIPGQQRWTSTPDGLVETKTETETPEAFLAEADVNEDDITQTPVKKDENEPTPTKTPSPTVNRPYISFADYWKGTWYIWFEDAGRLLEAELVFEQDGAKMIAKVEMAGHMYGFTLEDNGEGDVYKSFFKGEWQNDIMNQPVTFRLWPQDEKQAVGCHSEPVKTFCASRDKSTKPNHCFLWIGQ
jgi:hypothetical protein